MNWWWIQLLRSGPAGAALALNSSVPPFSCLCQSPFSLLGPHRNPVVKGPLQPPHRPIQRPPPKIGTFYGPGSRGKFFFFQIRPTMFCRRWVPDSMCPLRTMQIFHGRNICEFSFSILRYSWRVKFNLKYTIPQCLSFINIRSIQLFTRIIWLYSTIADWWVWLLCFNCVAEFLIQISFETWTRRKVR